MGKFLVAGILQNETIVNVDTIPIPFKPVTDTFQSIHTSLGGDSYNEALALKSLGDFVDYFSMIGKEASAAVLSSPENEITLYTDYILPKLSATPAAVIFYDKQKNTQIFEDIKDMRDTPYDLPLFVKQLPTADMVVLANANFCRPLLRASIDAGKKIAVKIRCFRKENEQYNEDFLSNAHILYMGDDNLDEDPYDFVKYIVGKYNPEIVILGLGAKGVLIYSRYADSYAHYNSIKTNEVVNTLGAGNALFSCFLHYYNQTHDAAYSIKNALIFASYKIGFEGTSNGFMTERQIEDWRPLFWKD